VIISFSEGGIGNQLFKFAFIDSVRKGDEFVVLMGYDDLRNVFDVPRHISISMTSRFVRMAVNRFIRPAVNLMSDMRIISTVRIDTEDVLGGYARELDSTTKTQGLIKAISYHRSGFFQCERFVPSNFWEVVSIKKKFLLQANKILDELPHDSYRVFVQVRRGDYEGYKVYGKTTMVSVEYYERQMNWFRKNKVGSKFILLGDDADWMQSKFGIQEDVIIPNAAEAGIDMALMSICQAGILSASSFGWWGAYMMKKRDVVFAPRYWLGFSSQCYYHAKPIANFMIEVDAL
jgi:hypothetical protein